MKWLATGFSALMNIVSAAPAAATRLVQIDPQTTWFQHDDGSFSCVPTIVLLLALGVAISIVGGVFGAFSSGPSETTEERTVRYKQEAARMRAEARRADAENDLIRSQINKARSAAEYSDIGDITSHDRKVRGLRRRI